LNHLDWEARMAIQGIICQGCGIEAPSKYVEFHQNIGMLVMRQTSCIKGNLCKNCVHSQFWKRTLTTVGIGWLGTISFIIAPIFVLMNVVRYLGALGMPAVPAGAAAPILNDHAIAKLGPHFAEIVDRINRNEPINAVATDVASRAGVTPGQLILYVRAIAANARQNQVQKTYGFPVQPVGIGPAAAQPNLPPLPRQY
jgi:hypothetical protein